jgi:hypothetical protein
MEPGADLSKVGIWAAVGGEPAQRVHGAQELDPGVLWWTNLTRAQTYMLGRWGGLKDTAFLGPQWTALLDERGQHGDAASVALWSETLARLAEWLSEWTRQTTGQTPWQWGDGNLADALADRWGWAQVLTDAPKPQPVLDAAYQESITNVPLGGMAQWAGLHRITLALPRTAHIERLWRERVPAGDFLPVPPALFPRSIEGRIVWLREQRQPLLVRVDRIEWHPGQDEVGRTWLGLRGRRFYSAEPEPMWMTGDEAQLLARWAKFEIEMAYQAEHWVYESPPTIWTNDALESPLGRHAPMLGLLGHAAWQAVASPTRDPQRRTRAAVTPRAIWQRAADRRMCFDAALPLIAQGIPLVSYGQGCIEVALDPHLPGEAVARLARQVRDAGFVLPRALAQALPLEASASHENPVDVAHWLARVGDPAIPWDLDRIVAPWLGPSGEVREVLNSAGIRLTRLPVNDVNPAWATWWRESVRAQLVHATARLKAAAGRRGRA